MIIKKLPARFIHLIQPLFISIIMSGIVSAIATWRSIGFAPEFAHMWLTAWPLSWVIAYPILLFVLPFAKRLTLMIVEPS